MEFVEQHFNATHLPTPEEEQRPSNRTVVTVENLEEAIKKLSTGKAASFDLLKDKTLKKALKESLELREKVSK